MSIPSKNNVTGFVLAGGKSRRMGADKGFLYFRGKQLVEYSLSVLDAFCGKVYISTANDKYRSFGYPLVYDRIAEKGPAGAIYTALNFTNTEINFFIPCDMPFIRPELFQFLFKNMGKDSAIVPAYRGVSYSATSVFRKKCAEIFRTELQKGNNKIIIPAKICGCKIVETDKEITGVSSTWFHNINSPGDLQKAHKLAENL